MSKQEINDIQYHFTNEASSKVGMVDALENWQITSLAKFTKNQIYIQNGFPCGSWNDAGIGMLQVRPFNITNDGNISIAIKNILILTEH